MESMVALRIKSIIAEKGLVQKAVALRVGFTEQQLCDMLNSRKVIRAEYLPAISKALGVEIPEIYKCGTPQTRAEPPEQVHDSK